MMRTAWGPRGAFAAALAIAAGHAGCGDEAKKRFGATCDRDGECESGLCYEEVCLDPEADEDADGLINRLEATLGTDHRNADSDGDGVPDASELDVSNANKDYDGDGRADAIESAIADIDDDCLPDQYDAEDAVQNGDLSPLVPIVCPIAGVCSADGATLAVVCDGPGDAARCDFAAVPGYEATEATCDEGDNDCDGATDEGLDCTPDDPLTVGLVAWYRLDGDGQDSGPNAHHGTVVGALPTADRLGADGKAMRFAADGDRIEAALVTHPVGAVDVTYVAWLRPEPARDRVAGAVVVGEGEGARSALVVAGPRACGVYATSEDDAVYAERGCAPDRHWSHLAVVRTGGAARVYLNGRRVASDTLPVGAPLVGTTLRLGLAAFVDGEATNSFRGALDDVRIWSRALSDAEITQVYLDDAPERVVGTEARPGASCRHVLEGAPADTIADGSYHLDPDGDGPGAGFAATCDMTRDGGGWTLAWAYELTAPGAFDSGPNAVTPRPGWGVAQADVPVSTTPPADPDTLGAVPYAAWPALGREVLFTSDLMDSVACEPGQGSFSDRTSGDVTCRVVEDLVAACDDLVPWRLDWGLHGPSLSAQNLFLYFDGSTAEHFPTHDPCGGNGFTNTPAPVRGAVWLRPTDTTVRWPQSCDSLALADRFDGTHVIDVDGDGPRRPGAVTCRFGLERGGWARVTENVARTIAEIGPRPREYFYVQGDRFYRSPVTDEVFLWDAFASVPGTWFWGSAEGAGTFACGDTPEGDMSFGIGCGAASGDAPRILPTGTPDAVAGATDLCEDPPGIFEPPSPDALCAVDAELWVRPARCVPDQPGATGDGGLAALALATDQDESPCWQAYGPAGFGDGFEASDDVPPGGQAPSVKVTNPEIGNLIYAYQLTHVDLTFIAGHTYRVSFAGRAEAARTVRLFVQTRDLAHAFGWADLPLATTWGRHELVFTAQQTSWAAMINFQLAEVSTAPVWLDDILVEDLGPG